MPRFHRDAVEIRTRDRRSLAADVFSPAGEDARGVAILAHAMFARRTTFTRPHGDALAELLADAGYVTIPFDFRGHGESGPSAGDGGAWSFDDLVRTDLPAVTSSARARWPGVPLVVLGHSLGGNAALASQGAGVLDADALVVVAANMWTRGDEPSLGRWVAKRALALGFERVCRRRGYFTARALHVGSDDEAALYMDSLARCVRTGRWTSDDGRDDYAALTAAIDVPVACVASEGDRLFCHPDCAPRMIARVRGPTRVERVTGADGGGAAPGHMGLVTSPRSRAVYRRVLAWIEGELAGGLARRTF